MKKAWIYLADRFDALAPRERLVVFLGLAASLIAVFYVSVLDPTFTRYQKAHDELVRNQQQINLLSTQQVALIQVSSADVDADVHQQIKKVLTDNERMRDELNKAKTTLATPDKMAGLLQDLIHAQKGLELVSVRSGKTEDLLAPPAGTSVPVGSEHSVYRQSVEVTVRGNYASLAEYLKKVEALPWRFYLGDLSLKVERYPNSTMTLKLYTLSLERAWLGF